MAVPKKKVSKSRRNKKLYGKKKKIFNKFRFK
ncbi:50S ribosomal protein L32 [Candidatus Vidania fulgoroideae]|nr:50S ribosomal protein L32 [Candidatus Vidania fulgoroideae]WDR79326.1 50S ribosomal protein L32 [Candidatus Vidania fulgoroideae]